MLLLEELIYGHNDQLVYIDAVALLDVLDLLDDSLLQAQQASLLQDFLLLLL